MAKQHFSMTPSGSHTPPTPGHAALHLVWGLQFRKVDVRLPGNGNSHSARNVDVRLPGKGNSNSHGARPVHQLISMIKWIQTSRLSILSLSMTPSVSHTPPTAGHAALHLGWGYLRTTNSQKCEAVPRRARI